MTQPLDLPPDSTPDAPIFEEDVTAKPRGWGAWMTVALGLVVMAVFFFGQTGGLVIGLIAMKVNDPSLDIENLANNATYDGTLLSLATFAGAVPAVLLILGFAWVAARDQTFAYLGLTTVRVSTMLLCLGATAVFIVLADTANVWFGSGLVHEFMERAYRSAIFKPLLWAAICVAAPVFEEVFFRGFLLAGWAKARYLGSTGAILLSTVIWTAIHMQYGPFELLQVFVLGIMFGIMRLKTGSIVPCIACHLLTNVVATAEAAWFAG